MNEIVTVNFRDDTIFAVKRDDGVFVAVTPICKALGISADMQRKRIQNDPILREGAITTIFPSAGGMQETFCLRLDLINGWLFTIDTSRVKDDEIRQKVLIYQRECYKALFRHFHGGPNEPEPVSSAYPSVPWRWQDTFAMAPLGAINDHLRLLDRYFGRRVAVRAYRDIPCLLPIADYEEPAPPDTDPEDCRDHLLAAMIDGRSVRDLLDAGEARVLERHGIKPVEGGFRVIYGHAAVIRIYAGTRWASNERWRGVLARLPGAVGCLQQWFDNGNHRATFVPWPSPA